MTRRDRKVLVRDIDSLRITIELFLDQRLPRLSSPERRAALERLLALSVIQLEIAKKEERA